MSITCPLIRKQTAGAAMCQSACTTVVPGVCVVWPLLGFFPAVFMQQIVLDVYKMRQEINFLGVFALGERMERRQRPKSLSFSPSNATYGCSSTCSAFGNSHSCTSTIQGIIYHRHLGKVLDGSDWCLRFSVTASSCLEPDDAPRGAVHSAD